MQEEENKECTFHPKLFAPKIVRTDEVNNPDISKGTRLSVYERLHKEAGERKAAGALAQHHLEAALLRECTFQVRARPVYFRASWLGMFYNVLRRCRKRWRES